MGSRPWEIDRQTGSNGPTIQRQDVDPRTPARRTTTSTVPGAIDASRGTQYGQSNDGRYVYGNVDGNGQLRPGYEGQTPQNGVVGHLWDAGKNTGSYGDIGWRGNGNAGILNRDISYPTPDTTPTYPGGNTYYSGGYSEAEENAILENYYKRYLALVAGYDAPDVGERPVDDLTDLIVARDVGARPEDVYTPLIKRRDVGDRPEDQWSSVIRETGDESLARSRSNWGSVAPMTANAFASAGGGRTAAPTVGAYGGGLMAGQGMDAASVRQNQVRHQSDLDAGASNWDDLRRSNAAMVDQANANRNADVGTLGANSLDNINAEMTVALRRAGLLHDENVDTWERAGVAADNDFAAEVAASQARHQSKVSDWEQAGRDAIHEQTLARIASQDRHQTEVDEWEQAGLAAKNGHNDFLRSSGLSLLQQMMSAGIDVSKLNLPDWLVGV